MISVLTNMPLLRSQFAFKDATSALNLSLERLATGKRVNRAADDPSAIVPITKMDARLKQIEAEIKKRESQIIEISARDGADSAIADMAIELQSLVVQAGNRDTLGDETLASLQGQVDGIVEAIGFTLETARFRGQALYTESLSDYATGTREVLVEVEPDPSDPDADPEFETTAVRTTLLDLKRGGALNLVDGDLEAAQDLVDGLVGSVSSKRAHAGNRIRTLETEISVFREEFINVSAGKSLLEDTDYAAETAQLVRTQILQQASVATQNIARQQAEVALTLLTDARAAVTPPAAR